MKTGSTIGTFEIVAPLGAGGMGEVYRAKDKRLDREVAIKVLPDAMTRDADRIARFEREAKLLASLNHPNIGAIHGFETAEGRKFLVLEFVEGQTLAQRLKAGAVPVEEALDIARQIAEALEAAHEKVIVHRDLKPGNVMVRLDGTVKVLDFGLARAMTDESSGTPNTSDSPTVTSPARLASPTIPGVIMGTAGYMSPEQARGKPLDKRSDIFSFGCVLYEMLTGQQPFAGETVTDSLGATLHKELDLSLLPRNTPPTIQLLLRRCLTKDRKRRLQDIGDARIEIENAIADPTLSVLGLTASTLGQADTGRPKWSVGAAVILAGVSLAAVLLVGVFELRAGKKASPTVTPLVRKYEIPLVHAGTWAVGQPAISPDGTTIAFVDGDQVGMRRLDSFETQVVADAERGVVPFWSPDSRWLGFAQGDKLYKVSASGGRPIVITTVPGRFSPVGGAAWTRDGRIYFSTGDTGILEVSANGGEPRMIVAPDPVDDDDFHELALLPDGRSLVFCVHSRTRPWYLASWDGKERKVVLQLDQPVRAPAYSPTGHILFERFHNDVSVWALPFSAERVEPTGSPFLVAAGDGDPSVSETGALALTRRASTLEGGELVSVNLLAGTVDSLLQTKGVYYDPALSPDGTTIAVAGFGIGMSDIWLADPRRGTRTRMTFDERTNAVLPRWSPEGREIAFAQTTASCFERNAADDTIRFLSPDGSGETRQPISGGYPTFDRDWTYIAFVRTDAETGRDICFMPLDGTSEAKPLLRTHASEEDPALSPDGRWLAYTSNESGMEEVYLTRFPSGQGKWQVSSGVGVLPHWSTDGSRLYYVDAAAGIYDVQITTDPRVMLTQPQRTIDSGALGINAYQGFAISADGQSLIAIRTGRAGGTSAIGLIENWFAEFKDRP
jgi:Tol biopolymer transport system component